MGYVSFTMAKELRSDAPISSLKTKFPEGFGYYDYIDSIADLPDKLDEWVESESEKDDAESNTEDEIEIVKDDNSKSSKKSDGEANDASG